MKVMKSVKDKSIR